MECVNAKKIGGLKTEQQNPNTINIDTVSTIEMVRMINNENRSIADAVDMQAQNISDAVDCITAKMKKGGRLFYIGAGTSGRLGILDASECPPTFSVGFDKFIGLIAGGDVAIRKAVENAEDSLSLAAEQLDEHCINDTDVVCAIAASGRTPYCIGGLKHAKKVGAATICIVNNHDSEMSKHSDIAIEVDIGHEPLSGSTRMKSGTAQKLVLNILSTATMIQQGKVYSNLMVDLTATNEKLMLRSRNMLGTIVPTATSQSIDEALKDANGSVKLAAVMLIHGIDAQDAKKILDRYDGFLRASIEKEDK